MTIAMLRVLTLFLSASVLSISARGAEWCPRHNESFPAAVIDLGEYKAFYFVPDVLYSEQGQTAIVYLAKNNQVFNISSAEGASDWFSNTDYEGLATGFSCDSITLEFTSAWLIDESGQHKKFRKGEVREAHHKYGELICSNEK